MEFSSVKCILLGDRSVGKTSIINKYKADYFSEDMKPTQGIDFHSLLVDVGQVDVHIQVWDYMGRIDKFYQFHSYFQECTGICLVYDIGNRESFDNIDKWYRDVASIVDSPKLLVLIGNKKDTDSPDKVFLEEGYLKAKEINAQLVETSAKDGTNIEFFFKQLSLNLCTNFHNLNP